MPGSTGNGYRLRHDLIAYNTVQLLIDFSIDQIDRTALSFKLFNLTKFHSPYWQSSNIITFQYLDSDCHLYLFLQFRKLMKKEIVQCGNFKFQKLYTREQIDKEVDKLAHEIDETFQKVLTEEPDAKFLILGVLNGAFMFTSEVVRRLRTPVQIQFVKITSYKGMESGELSIDSKIDVFLFKDAHVLILDDICDTGKTLAQLTAIVKGMHAKTVRVGVLVVRPDKVHEVEPDFAGLTCSGFIVGYGLDYNFMGRQYPEIYQKINE